MTELHILPVTYIHKYYKIDIKLDLEFILLGQFLQISIDRLILMTTIHFQITIVPISYKPITMEILSLEYKFK